MKREDPDPFTIASLVIAGAALLLNLEQKIEAKTISEKNEHIEKESSRIVLCLYRIAKSLKYLEEFWLFFAKIGQNVIIDDKVGGTAYGASRKYLDLQEYEEFNEKLDGVLYHIGIINKELYAIKLNDILLEEEVKCEFTNKIQELRYSLNLLLDNKFNIVNKLQAVEHSIKQAHVIVDELRVVISKEFTSFNVQGKTENSILKNIDDSAGYMQ